MRKQQCVECRAIAPAHTMRAGRCPRCHKAFRDAGYDSAQYRKARARNRGRRCETPGCPTPFDRVQLDHVNGDTSDNRPENLKRRCHTCHLRKHKR